jgi:signal transduction histidine kinase
MLTHSFADSAADIELATSAQFPAGHRARTSSARLDGATMPAALERLVLLIEQQIPTMRASVLLLGEDGKTLHHGAAPHLPVEYCEAIDGTSIGPKAGSCGTAAFRGEQVIVDDIATDPLWEDYKSLALPHNLLACWSTPIVDDDDKVIGTFAMYYSSPRAPLPSELALTHTAAALASTIIMRGRAERKLLAQGAELRLRTEIAERSADALAKSEAKMREARAEAEQADRAKSNFLAMMSHELRTPLNAIGGYAKLMLDGIPTPVSAAHQDYLRRIVRGQQHLLSVIDAVLLHAKLEAGTLTYQLEDIRMSELLDVVDSLIVPQITAKDLTYDCASCDSNLMVRGDKQKTVQILLNLLSNALKFTPPPGRITVRTEALSDQGCVAVGVRDTGVGMSAEQVAIVFEPYVQFENRLTPKAAGTGLGVSIAREMARGMGGDLTVQSQPNVGSEFLLTLPAAADGSGLPEAKGHIP